MTEPKSPSSPAHSRYMTLDEVAIELRLTRSAIYPKIYAGELAAVPVGQNGRGLRVLRSSFDAYVQRIEREAQGRFGGAA